MLMDDMNQAESADNSGEKSHTFRKRRLSLSRHNLSPEDEEKGPHEIETKSAPTEASKHPQSEESESVVEKQRQESNGDEKAHTFRKRRLSLTTSTSQGDDHAEPPSKYQRRGSDASALSMGTLGDGTKSPLRPRVVHAGEIVAPNDVGPISPTVNGEEPHVLYRPTQQPAKVDLHPSSWYPQPKWKKRHTKPHDTDDEHLPFPRDIVGTYSCHGVEPIYESDYEQDVDDDEDWGGEGAASRTIEPKEAKPTTVAKINQDRGGVAFPYGNCARTALFAAYDGHGQGGELVSQFALHEIQSRLAKSPDFTKNLKKAFIDTFLEVDADLLKEPLIEPLYAGTTACVALLREKTLTLANSGDSRAVVARRRKDASTLEWESVDLTVDQNPDLPEEKLRIESMGGFVSPPPEPGLSARVWLDSGFTQIGLAMARSIGDHAVARVGVIAEPAVTTHEVSDEDEFMIIASDGVWEFTSSDEAVSIVGSNLHRGATKACQTLIEAAASKWHEEEGDYRDDITALVVCLQKLWDKPSDNPKKS